jgi:hypothetical protein
LPKKADLICYGGAGSFGLFAILLYGGFGGRPLPHTEGDRRFFDFDWAAIGCDTAIPSAGIENFGASPTQADS